jgi:hypothetical protein
MSDTIKRDTFYLSKTLFIKGLQCHKALYLQKYHPELKDDVSDAKEALFSSGRDVGVFAQQLFPLYTKQHSATKELSARSIFSIKVKKNGRSMRSRVQRE